MPSRRTPIRALTALALFVAAQAAAAGLLATVKERGYVRCGVHPTNTGFAAPDTYGEWRGFDTDFCRALAAAILGDAQLVMFVSSDRHVGIDSLAAGTADVMARTPHAMGGLGGEGARHVGVLLHDSYGFLVPRENAALESLAGASVCVLTAAGGEEVVESHLKSVSDGIGTRRVERSSEALRAVSEKQCKAIAGLRSELAGLRPRLQSPEAFVLSDVELGKEPAGPRVRGGDDAWAKAVQWVLFALIEAEELGLTSATVESARDAASSARVRQLLGVEGELGAMLGLPQEWAYEVVRQVGSYGEIYTRNLGEGTPNALPRTRSRLWNAGGMLFAPPAVAR